MPRLSAFYGIVIYMYIRDHGVPHIHARYAEDEAVIEISSSAVLAGRLKPRQEPLVRTWVRLHRAELMDAWARASMGEPPGTIEPLP